MENKKGQLFFIMWTAWAWKWTLRKNLEKESDLWIEFVKSYVTRPMREWEIEGEHYHFITNEDFKGMISKNAFLEYEFVHNTAYYWTKLSDVIDDGIDLWKKVMKEIDMEWLKNIQTNHPELEDSITSIFLNLSPDKFKERIISRGATISDEEYNHRANSLIREIAEAKIHCDYIIDTSEKTPEEVFEEALKILKK